VVITVIGSGGKTSLIWRLAASFAAQPGRKVLVSPTTKMFLPPQPEPGITLAGCFNKSSGKLESLPDKTLKQIIAYYDFTLIEGDGAKGLPLKAWKEDEPVVLPLTTLTIGMLPLWVLGKTASENIVHRMPLFLTLTGAVAGEIIKPEHIPRFITGSKTQPGLFSRAQGKKLLFLNGAEDRKALEQGRKIASLLPAQFRSSLYGIIAGSVRDDWVSELY
jgi:probable selenium-dependent hydroxylase accessory protein YqeC